MAGLSSLVLLFAVAEAEQIITQGIGEVVQAAELVKLARSRGTNIASASHTNHLKNASLRFTTSEALTWLSYIVNGRSYLEWGSGGSTVLASWLALHEPSSDASPRLSVLTIDHSAAFVQELRDRSPLVLQRAEKRGSLHFRIPDIGATGEWGRPINWAEREREVRLRQARGYVEPAGIGCCFDVIFVDGRFREVSVGWGLNL
jgi:hypothetical protein